MDGTWTNTLRFASNKSEFSTTEFQSPRELSALSRASRIPDFLAGGRKKAAEKSMRYYSFAGRTSANQIARDCPFSRCTLLGPRRRSRRDDFRRGASESQFSSAFYRRRRGWTARDFRRKRWLPTDDGGRVAARRLEKCQAPGKATSRWGAFFVNVTFSIVWSRRHAIRGASTKVPRLRKHSQIVLRQAEAHVFGYKERSIDISFNHYRMILENWFSNHARVLKYTFKNYRIKNSLRCSRNFNFLSTLLILRATAKVGGIEWKFNREIEGEFAFLFA